MKTAIIGSRDFNDYALLIDTINNLSFNITTVISGGARGADSLAERYAYEFGKETIIFKPNWDKYGKKAGMLRNADIINEADFILAFWDGESKGTLDSIKKAKKLNKEIKVINYSLELSLF